MWTFFKKDRKKQEKMLLQSAEQYVAVDGWLRSITKDDEDDDDEGRKDARVVVEQQTVDRPFILF